MKEKPVGIVQPPAMDMFQRWYSDTVHLVSFLDDARLDADDTERCRRYRDSAYRVMGNRSGTAVIRYEDLRLIVEGILRESLAILEQEHDAPATTTDGHTT